MTFSVTIGTDTFEVYGDPVKRATYLNGMISSGASTFRGLVPDDQARVHVQATRYIDSLAWQGAATTPPVGGTTLQWPRTGVIDSTGAAVDSSTVPANLVNAVFELCALIADDPDLIADGQSNLRGMGAGPIRLDFFTPQTAQDETASPLPKPVARLIAQYLAEAVATSSGSISTGTDGVSTFDVDDDSGNDLDPWARSWPE